MPQCIKHFNTFSSLFSEDSPYDKGVLDAKELKPKKFYPIAPDGMYLYNFSP